MSIRPPKNLASSTMTVHITSSTLASAGSLDTASDGCIGLTMLCLNHSAPVRSCRCRYAAGSDKLHERRKTHVDEKFRAGSMNVGIMKVKSHEVVETANQRMLDATGLQETIPMGITVDNFE